MLKKINTFLGKEENFSLEIRTYIFINLIGFIFSTIGVISNIILGLPFLLNVLNLFLSISALFLFYRVRFQKNHKYNVELFFITYAIVIFGSWFLNGGIIGSVPIYILLLVLLLLFISDSKVHKLIMISIAGLFLCFYGFENFFPELIVPYPTILDRDIDVIVSIFAGIIGIGGCINFFKRVYEQNRRELELKIVEITIISKVAELEKEKAEQAKKEIEFIHEFTKVINSSNILEVIFSEAESELKKRLDADIFILQLIDKNKNFLFTRCLIANTEIEYQRKLFKEKIPLTKEAGSVFKTFNKRKTLYLRNIQRAFKNKHSFFDNLISNFLELKSLLQIPLLIEDEVIGIIHINKKGGMRDLSKEDIRFCETLCEQLAVAVNTSYLFEQNNIERQKSEKLLLNILPIEIANELKEKGFAEPVLFESVSVMFTDFEGFTQIAETLSPSELIKELDACFVQFDKITERNNLEKLKTIGDSYMCAGGIPKKNSTHALDSVLAALEIQDFMNQMKVIKESLGLNYWELRLGIHSGPLVAGVIGEKKFTYDVWGDTVNSASRMESSGTPGKINISGPTYELVKDFFDCQYRGEIPAKNKGMVQMYYVHRIKEEFSKDKLGKVPNGNFWKRATMI
jgi:class 3 adenylate cyclase